MKALKIVGIAVAAIVVLLMAATLIIASVFDPNDYKGVVTDAFEARTGRTLTIDKKLTLSYFPWLAVETGGITIGNGAGFGGANQQAFATVERAAARVKLMPLLDRRVEIGTVELDGLTLNLARDAELRGNWQDLADAASGPGAASAAMSPVDDRAPSVQNFALEGVRVRRGTVNWHENATELRYSVTDLNLTTGTIDRNKPVPVDVSLQFRNEANGLALALETSAIAELGPSGAVALSDVKTHLKLDLEGTSQQRELTATAAAIHFDRTQQTLKITALATDVAGVKAAWDIEGRALLDSAVVEGNVQIAESPLSVVFAQLGLKPPAGIDAGELGTFSASGKFAFHAEPREIAVSGADIRVLGLRVSGDGTFKGKNELQGRIVIPEFTPNRPLQAVLRTNVPPTIDVSALDKLALSTRFDANIGTGRAALHDLKATVLGASLTGELEAIPGDKGNTYRGNVATSRFAPDGFTKAFAKLMTDKLDPKKLGSVQLKTRFVFDSGADTLSVAPFEAEAFGLRGSGEINGRNVTKAAAWTGTAKVAQFSPKDLMQRFGLPPLQTSDPKALTRATIDAKFDVDANRGRFQDLTVALDDSKIAGDFAVEGFKNPQYKFTLAIDRVDADRYLPPKARDAKAGQRTAGDIELPTDNTMRLDGNVQVTDLRLAGLQFADIGTRIVLDSGNAKLENARARLYGGEFKGNFNVQATGKEPGLALDGHATGLQLKPMIAALTGADPNFSGTGTFDLDLRGSGRTIMDNVKTAGGKVSFAMRDGAIRGFNLGSILCSAYNLTQRVSGPRGEQPKETAFQTIQGSANVTSGVAQSPDLLARTAFMDVTGKGTLGLADQKLDYDLTAKLTNRVPIAGCETMAGLVGQQFPFDIHGTVTNPKVTPDFSKIIRDRVKDEAKDRLKDKILRGILR